MHDITTWIILFIFFALQVAQYMKGNSNAYFIHWLSHELELTRDKLSETENKINAFTAGHIHATEKPERTPGMP